MTALAPALAVRGICKRYGAVQANDQVELTVAQGTVHAVVGENGAGKSTLMKIVYGLERADAGSVSLKGVALPIGRHSPARAIGCGVGMVHQHFMLVGPLTVVENLVLGREPTHRGLLALDEAARQIAALAAQFGFEVDPWAKVEQLSVGEQQRVEILKVLWHGCDVLILDEPTAVLTPAEVGELFAVLRGLVADGKTVVLISHKLDEVTALADRITVMRGGRVVTELAGDASTSDIAQAMVGRPVLLQVERPVVPVGEPVLVAKELRVAGATGEAVCGVSFELRAGEVLGIAGVQGNGQSELVEAIAGLRPVASGELLLGGKVLAGASVVARQRAGLSHIPEDRHLRGLVLEQSVRNNLLLGRQREPAFQREFAFRGVLCWPEVQRYAESRVAALDIRPPDTGVPAEALSGGNQQKLVMARELDRPGLKLLLCAQPTRGVDIGAVQAIHRRMLAVRERGAAVLLVSAELSEVCALSDRIAVMYRGRFVALLPAAEATRERLGALMTGAGH